MNGDKGHIREFHSVSSGVGRSLRDASNGSSSGPWKNQPTPISVPSNHGHSKSSDPGNPFSAKRMKNTITGSKHDKQGETTGNRTASMTPFSTRSKIGGSGMPSKHFPNPTRRPLQFEQAQIPDIIEVDRRSSSPDPLLMPPPRRVVRVDPAPPLNMVSQRTSRHKIAQDGPAKKKLENKLEKRLEDLQPIIIDDEEEHFENDSDLPFMPPEPGPSKLESVSPARQESTSNGITRKTTPTRQTIPSGRVQAQVKQFESGHYKRDVPILDLVAKSGGVKKAMKGKSSAQVKSILQNPNSVPRNSMRPALDESTAPTEFVTSNQTPEKRQSQSKQRSHVALPLKAFFRGCEMYKSEDLSEPFYLIGDSKTLTVASGSDSSSVLFSFGVNNLVDTIECTSSGFSSDDTVVVKIKTKKPRVQSEQETSRFHPGSRGQDGQILFHIKPEHEDCDVKGDYAWLLKTFPTVDHLDKSATTACLEGMRNAIDLFDAQEQREISTSTRAKSQTSHPPNDPISDAEEANYLRVQPRQKVRKSSGPEDTSSRATRSSSRLLNASRRQSPALDPDELVLVYPPNGTGAVNLTRGDLKRLEPGQYLNDTLIEFGLKLVLSDIKDEQPDFADQVHVFSSFFYKKFNVKNKEEGYRSVRKWTSKFDLFKKKYLVVPINENLHWYLAIICNPEYVLYPPPPELPKGPSVQTRKRKRDSDAVELDEPPGVRQALASDTRPGSPLQGRSASVDADENHVESMLDGRATSPSGEESASVSATTPPQPETEELQYPSSDEFASMDVDITSNPPAPDDISMGTITRDVSPDVCGSTAVSVAARSLSPDMPMQVDEHAILESVSTVPATRFYGKIAKRRLQSAPLEVVDSSQEIDAPVEVPDTTRAAEMEPNRPYIFTFDSLGTAHPSVIKNLSFYMQLEAKDKKNLDLDMTTPAKGRTAIVPAQPNFCDCGVYLLHFVKTFLKDPQRATERILTKTRGKDYTSKEREVDWDADNVGGLREELLARAESLATQWKQDRAAKEEAKKKESEDPSAKAEVIEDSDDEIIVSEVVMKPKSAKGKGKTKGEAPPNGETKAKRLR